MKKIEQAPNWKNEKLLNKGLKLFINNDYKKIIMKLMINIFIGIK